jgi:hypothetical protein
MANNVDLNFDAKRAMGQELPTVTVDFVDISYGYEIDEASGEKRLVTRASNGTHIGGSFSIYFTKEAAQSNAEIAGWLRENLDQLYLYSWLSAWKGINKKVKESRLDLREIFYAMEPAHWASFNSDHPAYPLVVEEMKDKFLNGNWYDSTSWNSFGEGTWDGAAWTWDNSMVPTREEQIKEIDREGSWTFNRFWGQYGKTEGPWNAEWSTTTDYVDSNGDGSGSLGDLVAAGVSFMDKYINWTLRAWIGTDVTGDYSSFGRRFNVIKLADYIEEDGRNVKIEGLYDNEGDEIGVILNLPINFEINNDSIEGRFDDDGEIYIIAAIGRKVLDDMTWQTSDNDNPGTLTSDYKEMNSTLFNSNFGDITYEHILSGAGHSENTMTIANEPEEIFVSVSSGSPVDGKPIMSIDGTYHASRPFNQAMVVSSMNQVLNKYGSYIDSNLEIKQNLSNLARILGDHGESIDLLRRLQSYRKSYMQKSTATVSGKMYEAFKKLLYNANQSVIKQPKLKKILIVNNKIVDSRMSAENVSYVAPRGTGNGGDVVGGGKETAHGGSYIPEEWSMLTRRAVKTVPIEGRGLLGEMAQYILEEGLPIYVYDDVEGGTATGTAYGAGAGSGGDFWRTGIGYQGESDETRDEYTEWYDNFVRNRAMGAPSSLLDVDDLGGGVSPTQGIHDGSSAKEVSGIGDLYQDTVVENKGFFFFDYEKALQTHSKLSYVITPWKIERYLGLHVPWDFFRVTEVRLIRKELQFTTHMSEEEAIILDGYPFDEITIQQKLTFARDKEYPKCEKTTYNYYEDNFRYGQPFVQLASSWDGSGKSGTDINVGSGVGEVAAAAGKGLAEAPPGFTREYDAFGADMDISDYSTNTEYSKLTDYYTEGYEAGITDFSPVSDMGMNAITGQRSGEFLLEQAKKVSRYIRADQVVPAFSYLKMMNFDAPFGYRDEFDPATSYIVSDPDRAKPTGMLWNFRSAKSRGGYRVMALEYRDYMDDDVAYYNTIGRDEFAFTAITVGPPSPPVTIGEYRSGDAGPTRYKIEIDVEDTSLKMVKKVYDIFNDSYNKFIDNYYNLAIATCSFNNINDQFNEFFANGIKEKYPKHEDREWIRAPYMFNIARNILFGTYAGTDLDAGAGREVEAVEQRMRDGAEKTARLIGPDDGRLYHLNRFKQDYEKLLNLIKPRTSSPTTAPTGQRLFGPRDAAHPGGEFGGPVYTYHPVYDRMLAVSGIDEEEPGSSWSTATAIHTAWDTAVDQVDTYMFRNAESDGTHGWKIDSQIYGDMFLSALHEWDYTPPVTTISYVEIYKFLENVEGLLYQANVLDPGWAEILDTSGYRGLMDLPVWTEYGIPTGTFSLFGSVMVPPGHYEEELHSLEDVYEQWIKQLILFAFVNQFHRTLEDGLGLAPYYLFQASFFEIQVHIMDIARESEYYGSAAEADSALSGPLTMLLGAAITATDSAIPEHNRLLASRNIWSKGGIEAIATKMNPRIYYSRHDAPGTLPNYDKPIIEYTHIFQNMSNSGKWEITDDFDDHYYATGDDRGGGKYRVICCGGSYITNTEFTISSFRIGFVPRNHTAATNSLYTRYPGDYSPIRNFG